jgi:hypothetical protein
MTLDTACVALALPKLVNQAYRRKYHIARCELHKERNQDVSSQQYEQIRRPDVDHRLQWVAREAS